MLEQTRIINELVAGAPSPIPYDNSLYYAARMTGTGDVWRNKLGAMYRPADYYMTQEFLDRCAGVPVIMNHPSETATIDPANAQIVGTVIYAYPHPDDATEIWCVMRIIDGLVQADLLTQIMSTSPSIIVAGSVVSDGVIVEGAPIAAPDHLAICALGVWDHEGPPQGIDQTIMPEPVAEAYVETLIENAGTADTENPEKTTENDAFSASAVVAPQSQFKLGDGKEVDLTAWLSAIETPAPKYFDFGCIKPN
ncbi:MAG: hypothetical protein V4807_12190 [Burkholderia gladioli]|uniref:hypothetical protein n=1 Tax=Burkholderia gladioli TaxID=28095 RepID=UPI0028666052|nr:hypothetical protein [Burkholderia gladioli]MDR8091103.1 hypothetical protein [Burkholderia gladioli]